MFSESKSPHKKESFENVSDNALSDNVSLIRLEIVRSS